jgi:5,10-methylenetetrahydromethanopterin reductase
MGPSELSISSDGRDAAAAFLGKVTLADRAGLARIWIANHLFQRDPVARAAAALGASRSLPVALMAMSPLTVHPVQLAMAAATLDEMHPGRVGLCLGAGAPADLASVGIDGARPLRALRETLRLTRALLAGETVTFEGETCRVRARRLATGAQALPVMLAASGPEMLKLAGAEADAVLISAGASLEHVRWSLDQVALGASRRAIRRVGLVYCAVADTRGEAHDGLRRTLAITLRGAHHARNLALAGNRLDQERLRAAVAAEDWTAAVALVGDRIVETHAASGTPAEVAARLRAYRQAGLDEIVIAGVAEPDQLARIIAAAGVLVEGEP